MSDGVAVNGAVPGTGIDQALKWLEHALVIGERLQSEK
jgi:hypothetical protein